MPRRNREYEVEDVIGKRDRGNQAEYLIKWKGFPRSQSTWEPAANLRNVRDLVSKFDFDLQASKTQKLNTRK